jgi:hypothetical protein
LGKIEGADMKAIAFLLVILFLSCGNENDFDRSSNSITMSDLQNHIAISASDQFEGRRPNTNGEKQTVKYLKEQFRNMELDPANNNQYIQQVSLVEIISKPHSQLILKNDNEDLSLNYQDDFVAISSHISDQIVIKNREIVFAGFGIVPRI